MPNNQQLIEINIAANSILDNDPNTSHNFSRLFSQKPLNVRAKKCWICLSNIDLDLNEQLTIQKYFFEENIYFLSDHNRIKTIHIKIFKRKFLLSVCKCRKKLAHLNCFEEFIDLKQNGDINVDIVCPQCNYKYVFDYPYNSNFI